MRAPSLNATTETLPTEEEGYEAQRLLLSQAGGRAASRHRARRADGQSNPGLSPPGPAANTQDEPIKRTVLFRGDLEGAPGKEIVVFVADLAPGAVGSKHYHPGPEFFYVLEGTLAHEPEGGSPHMMKTGAFGSNPNKGIHLIRNPSTTERARAIDFLIAEKGQPIVISVK
jgi:quercetin dioxygenase-like cupin family protein